MIFLPFISCLYVYNDNCNNSSSSIACCCFSGGMYISLDILVGCGVSTVVDFFGSAGVLFEGSFVIFSAILVSTGSSVASAVFWIALFETVLKVLVAKLFVMSRSFCLYLLLRFLFRLLSRIRIHSL